MPRVCAARCPEIRCLRGRAVCPTYWFRVVHRLHSIRYTTLGVLQMVFCGVGKEHPVWEEKILGFRDMWGQHLHRGVLLGAEWLLKEGRCLRMMGSSDVGGVGVAGRRALTRWCAVVQLRV